MTEKNCLNCVYLCYACEGSNTLIPYTQKERDTAGGFETIKSQCYHNQWQRKYIPKEKLSHEVGMLAALNAINEKNSFDVEIGKDRWLLIKQHNCKQHEFLNTNINNKPLKQLSKEQQESRELQLREKQEHKATIRFYITNLLSLAVAVILGFTLWREW